MRFKSLVKKAEKLGYIYDERTHDFSFSNKHFTWSEEYLGSFYVKTHVPCFGNIRVYYKDVLICNFLSIKDMYKIMRLVRN